MFEPTFSEARRAGAASAAPTSDSISFLVSLLSRRWNSFFDNLLDVHQKLKAQGFLYYNGKVKILNDEEVSK